MGIRQKVKGVLKAVMPPQKEILPMVIAGSSGEKLRNAVKNLQGGTGDPVQCGQCRCYP